jgi:mannitol/fructose-specific phosphotransferase system IIA component (Ntr-type)/phosphotransferase system HPr-like phosphotransfer protein
MFRVGESEAEAVRFDSIYSFMVAEFKDGEELVLEVDGGDEDLASDIFRLALQNLRDPEQATAETAAVDNDRVESHLIATVDAAFLRMVGEDFDAYKDVAIAPAENASSVKEFAYLNDRLHNLTVPMLPTIARFYNCVIELRFETKSGVHVCKLEPTSDELIVREILLAAPEAGTRITIIASGEKRKEACATMQSVLNNLRQCDQWLRHRKVNLDRDMVVAALIAYAGSLAQLPKHAATNPYSPEISNLLSEDRVIVYLPSSSLSKEEVLHQLVALLSTHYTMLVEDDLLASVWARERQEPVILRDGLAVPHASIQHGPRIAMAMAVVPKGVQWDVSKPKVRIIILFIFADDTHQTYLEHVGQLAAVFKGNEMLQETLVCGRNAREIVRLFRESEEILR